MRPYLAFSQLWGYELCKSPSKTVKFLENILWRTLPKKNQLLFRKYFMVLLQNTITI